MGSTTTNLGLYKPDVSETGWGSLVDTNWDTLDAVGGGGAGMALFGQAGALVTQVGVARFLFPFNATLIGAVAAVATAPTGATILVDVNLNGTTIFSTQGNRPTIAVATSATTTQPTPNTTSVSTGDYLTIDVDQVGSTIAGSDLTVQVLYRVTA